MNLRIISAVLSALGIGVALGYMLPKTASEAADTSSEKKAYHPKKEIESYDMDSTIEALRARIKELEAALSENESRIEAPKSDRRRDFRSPERGNMGPREMMENLKKEDPERYAQITNSMERWRVRREAERTSRLNFLKSIDTSSMSAGTRSTHQMLLANTDKIAELEAMIRDENTTDEERRGYFEELRELHDTQRQLNNQERENLIEQISMEVGMSAEDAAEFSMTIKEILEATEAGGGRGPRGFGGPGPGGMPPPPPPGM